MLKGKLTDIILILFAAYMLFTVDWTNILPHQRLLMLVYALCIALKLGNYFRNKKQ